MCSSSSSVRGSDDSARSSIRDSDGSARKCVHRGVHDSAHRLNLLVGLQV
jgi:hypothetical protein